MTELIRVHVPNVRADSGVTGELEMDVGYAFELAAEVEDFSEADEPEYTRWVK
jgi:hypothetical protein